MKTIRVAAGIIKRKTDGLMEIFATQRGHGAYKDWWEFPGGKLEEGETSEEAVGREIQEELGVKVAVDEMLCSVEYDYPDFHLSMDCFYCHVEEGEIKLLEHEAARWLSKETLDQVNWLPADTDVLKRIKETL